MYTLKSQSNHLPWIAILIGTFLRLININTPIVGIHSWRQADTAAMARHFALENTPIWLPQIDWAGATKGFVESEFPIFPYLLGNIYKLFGINEWIGRGLSILFSVLTIILIVRVGTILLDPISGWWGGIFFALMPISTFYGRTLQAESFLILLSAISIERILTWKKNRDILDLIISWGCFVLACLIKVLPFIWLTPPILFILLYPNQLEFPISVKHLLKSINNIFSIRSAFIFIGSSILICIIWYVHSYNLGQSTGLSFGFWGSDSDRSSLKLILNLNIWLNLFLRFTLRNVAILGLPLLILGTCQCYKNPKGQVLILGMVGVFLSTCLAFNASSIHEYYQLPLQLYICPIMGKGLCFLNKQIHNKKRLKVLKNIGISLITIISLSVMYFDYWSIESMQSQIWMPLALKIRESVPAREKIVTITNSDPTLLNLARRKGWIASSENVTIKQIYDWDQQGATHITGSLNWKDTHTAFSNAKEQNRLQKLICHQKKLTHCTFSSSKLYLIPLKEIIE